MPIPFFPPEDRKTTTRLFPGLTLLFLSFSLILTGHRLETSHPDSPVGFLISILLATLFSGGAMAGIRLVEAGHRGSGFPILRNLFRGQWRNVLYRSRLAFLYGGIWTILSFLWILPFILVDGRWPLSRLTFPVHFFGELYFRGMVFSWLVWFFSRRKGYTTMAYTLSAGIVALGESAWLATWLPGLDGNGFSVSIFFAWLLPSFILGAIHFRHGLETTLLTRTMIFLALLPY